MGKNSVIKSLGRNLGNAIAHKIVSKYTNIPNSANHMGNEAVEYRDNAIKIAKEFNWNQDDKEEIKKEVLKNFNSKMKNKYANVKFPIEEANNLIDEAVSEVCGKFN